MKEANVSGETAHRISAGADRISAGAGSKGRILRVGLLLLSVPQLAIGAWALFAPRDWFESFPGGGNEWLPLYGPFDEHLVNDVGSTFVAIGLVLIVAAVWLDRRAVQLALVAYLAYQIPHFVYHLGADDALSNPDRVVNGVALGAAVAAAAALLVLTREGAPRTRRAEGAVPPGDGTGSRLRTTPGGPFARMTRWYSRRSYGDELAPVNAYLHHRRLLLGYGAFETAVERSSKVDERLKALAETKTAAVVGCEWCMDFGSRYALDHGVPEAQLRELPRHRDSDAFDAIEKLVLDYAAAMSRTPAEVPDELVSRLQEQLDDPQLVELTTAIAIENFRARFNHALGLDSQGFSEGAYCVVPELATVGDGDAVSSRS
jgi:alkylhydroperoxidase family enzyme